MFGVSLKTFYLIQVKKENNELLSKLKGSIKWVKLCYINYASSNSYKLFRKIQNQTSNNCR